MTYAIEIENLIKDYKGHEKAVDVEILSIPESCVFGLLGRNGAGKSTLISMISGILKPTKGIIRFFGTVYNNSLKSQIGMVPQNIALYPSLTVIENLNFFANILKIPKNEIHKICMYYIDLFELSTHCNSLVSSCSGGMKRRLNLAVALLNNPKILLLDEPTVGIDPYSRSLIYDKVKDCAKKGMSILYSTHYIDEIPKIADLCCIIDNGKILENDTPDNLLKKFSSKRIFIKLLAPLDSLLFKRISSFKSINLSDDKCEISFQYENLSVNLHEIIDFLKVNEVEISAITSRKESMEEVFLNITKEATNIL